MVKYSCLFLTQAHSRCKKHDTANVVQIFQNGSQFENVSIFPHIFCHLVSLSEEVMASTTLNIFVQRHDAIICLLWQLDAHMSWWYWGIFKVTQQSSLRVSAMVGTLGRLVSPLMTKVFASLLLPFSFLVPQINFSTIRKVCHAEQRSFNSYGSWPFPQSLVSTSETDSTQSVKPLFNQKKVIEIKISFFKSKNLTASRVQPSHSLRWCKT